MNQIRSSPPRKLQDGFIDQSQTGKEQQSSPLGISPFHEQPAMLRPDDKEDGHGRYDQYQAFDEGDEDEWDPYKAQKEEEDRNNDKE